MTESGGRWAALKNATQFANLLQRDVPRPGPTSYLTTGVYDSFKLMVHSQGRSPISSFLWCSMFSDALGLPQAAYPDFPRSREWEVGVDRYHALFAAFGIQSQNVLLRLTNWWLYFRSHERKFSAGLDAEWEELLTRWTLGVQTRWRMVQRFLSFRRRRRLRRGEWSRRWIETK